MEEWLEKISDPIVWRDRVEDGMEADCRRKWMQQVKEAKDFVNNIVDPSLPKDQNNYWYKSSSYIRIRNYLLGRLAFGNINAKVVGVEFEDEAIAYMYEKAIEWEFTRPRGIYRTIGRQELSYALSQWVDFGLGAVDTYFDPFLRDKENYTGNIITECVPATDLILDPQAPSLGRINWVARKYEMTPEDFRFRFPSLDPPPLTKGDRIELYEIQFRCNRPITAKINKPDLNDVFVDRRIYWKSFSEFRSAFEQGLKKRKSEDASFKPPYHPNKRAEEIYRQFPEDVINVPLVYRILIASHHQGAVLVQEPIFVGDDFSLTLIPFIETYDSPYPKGAPYFVADLQRMEVILKTLYVRQMLSVVNQRYAVVLSKVDSPKQMDALTSILQFQNQIGGVLPLKNVQRVEEAVQQMRVDPPSQATLELAKYMRWEIDEFFNTHEAQTGMPPFAGASGELTRILQAAGSYPLSLLIHQISKFSGSVFRKIAKLIYEYMPSEKRIAVSDLDQKSEVIELKREKMRKADPNDFDIEVKMDTDSDQDKQLRFQKAMLLYQNGLIPPQKTLEEAGYKREAAHLLSQLETYRLGQTLAQWVQTDKDFASQVNAYLKMKSLELEERGSKERSSRERSSGER